MPLLWQPVLQTLLSEADDARRWDISWWNLLLYTLLLSLGQGDSALTRMEQRSETEVRALRRVNGGGWHFAAYSRSSLEGCSLPYPPTIGDYGDYKRARREKGKLRGANPLTNTCNIISWIARSGLEGSCAMNLYYFANPTHFHTCQFVHGQSNQALLPKVHH